MCIGDGTAQWDLDNKFRFAKWIFWESAKGKHGGHLKEPGSENLGRLFLSLIGAKYTIEQAKERTNLSIEEIAELISMPGSDTFFSKESGKELRIYCNYGWITENISENVNLRGNEKKDLAPLLQAKKKFEFIVKNYPDTDYSTDAYFKLDLIVDQLAAKEISIARFYMQTEKWIPALNRLKLIVEKYDKTIFIEEALHRLVEVNYKIGLEDEAKKAAAILGYNYQSSEWYERSYKIFNKKYKPKKVKKEKEMGLLRKKIKGLFE